MFISTKRELLIDLFYSYEYVQLSTLSFIYFLESIDEMFNCNSRFNCDVIQYLLN